MIPAGGEFDRKEVPEGRAVASRAMRAPDRRHPPIRLTIELTMERC
jgi:hypothetical protein